MAYPKESHKGLIRSLSHLRDASTTYYGELVFLIVSINIARPSRFYVTDFTANPLILSDFTRENYIRTYDERIPEDQIIQLNIYDNKMRPFMDQIKKVRGEELILGDRWTCVLDKGIFARASIRFKMFNGTLEGIINSISLLDEKLGPVDLSLPVFKNSIVELPDSYIFDNVDDYKRTIPEAKIRQLINNPNSIITHEQSSPAPVIEPFNQVAYQTQRQLQEHYPYAPDTPSSPAINANTASRDATSNFKLSSVADLPEDTSHDRDYTPIHRPPPSTQVPQTQVQATYQEEDKINFIEEWNHKKTTDGKVFEFTGRVVEVEPLMNQLCIKYDVDKPPVLNPINIIVRSGPRNREPDEDQFMRISFVTKMEIYNFLGMHELELIYVKSSEIYEKFQKILKSKNLFYFKVSRRLIKVNNFGNFIYGWEGPGMTLDELYKQA